MIENSPQSPDITTQLEAVEVVNGFIDTREQMGKDHTELVHAQRALVFWKFLDAINALPDEKRDNLFEAVKEANGTETSLRQRECDGEAPPVGGRFEVVRGHDRHFSLHNEAALIDQRQMKNRAMGNFLDGVLYEGSARRTAADQSLNEANASALGEFSEGSVPGGIICIPAAILAEDPKTILRTFANLSKQEGIEDVEIVLWANYLSGDSPQEDAEARYSDLLITIGANYPSLKVKPVLKTYDKEILEQDSMLRVRSDFMDMVVLDTQSRGLGAEMPILWLDADTISMSSKTVKSLMQGARETDTFGVKANLRYTDTEFSVVEKIELSNPRHAAALDELARRASQQEFVEKSEYLEECGFCFELGNYVLVGGVKPVKMMDFKSSGWETNSLATGLKEITDGLRFAEEPGGWEYRFTSAALFKIGTKTDLAEQIDSARLYTDARRLVDSYAKLKTGSDDVIDPRDTYSVTDFFDEGYRNGRDRKYGDINAGLARTLVNAAVEKYYPATHVNAGINKKIKP